MGKDTIEEALSSLARSLRASTVFPATLLVLVNAQLASTWSEFEINEMGASEIAMTVSLVLIISYMFSASGLRLMNLFSGRGLKRTLIGQALMARKKRRFRDLRKDLGSLRKERVLLINEVGFDPDGPDAPKLDEDMKNAWQDLKASLIELETILELYYPSEESRLCPTAVGNVVEAVQEYTSTRYGMDYAALWPRLSAVLVETAHGDLVDRNRDTVNFLMNTLVAVVLLSLEILYLTLFLGHIVLSAVVLVLAVVLCAFLYTGMVWAMSKWGGAVRVAFDLGRHDLCKRLGLRSARSFESEYQRWEDLSRFLIYRRKGVWFQGFLSQREVEERENVQKDALGRRRLPQIGHNRD